MPPGYESVCCGGRTPPVLAKNFAALCKRCADALIVVTDSSTHSTTAYLGFGDGYKELSSCVTYEANCSKLRKLPVFLHVSEFQAMLLKREETLQCIKKRGAARLNSPQGARSSGPASSPVAGSQQARAQPPAKRPRESPHAPPSSGRRRSTPPEEAAMPSGIDEDNKVSLRLARDYVVLHSVCPGHAFKPCGRPRIAFWSQRTGVFVKCEGWNIRCALGLSACNEHVDMQDVHAWAREQARLRQQNTVDLTADD